ncbi:MAG: LysM peptidoglycan-binding domain-containing protein [Desulfobacterales bacterium]|nr:LysM peptidoglycan-binding domain-containing protein [Desulfobacterales bacterium]
MDLKEPYNSDKINEIPEESVFDAEEYPGWTNDKKAGFISKLFSKPLMPFGWIGLLLLVLIILFVAFIPRNHKTKNNPALKTIEDRLNVLEEKLAKFEELVLQVKQLDEQSKEFGSVLNRFDEMETSISSRMDQFVADLSDLKENKTRETSNQTKTLKSSKDSTKTSTVRYHKVRAGENLFRIGMRYGLTVNELRRLNKLGPNAVIQPGQKLIISRP